MRTSEAGRKFIESFEGCRLTAYKDSSNVWTIGYGHTGGVTEGQRITQAQADELFASDLGRYEGYTENAVKGCFSPSQTQFDALVSYCYNCGAGALRQHISSDFGKMLEGMMATVWSGGQALLGLKRRRIAEARLFLGGGYSTAVTDNEYARYYDGGKVRPGCCNVSSVINGYSCSISGENITRGTDCLVLYTKGKSTGTNAFGTECVIDSNGIVVTAPVYGNGNSIIPAGCRVLSGNGIASKWIKDHIKLGYRVWFGDGKANAVVGTFSSISNFNGQRTTNALIVYNSGKTTNTNPYGYEIAVDKSGEAICDPIYGKGHMEIPKGGFVLSGHGSSGGWINSHIHRGDTVLINGNIVSVK